MQHVAVCDGPDPEFRRVPLARLMHGFGLAMNILIADDDYDVRKLLASAFRKDGYRITEAKSGPDLFDQLWNRASSRGCFDLIISDVRMPGYTGLEVLGLLRSKCDPADDYEPQLRETPIIFITAFGDREVHQDAKRLGAVVFDKPFDVDELRAYARKLARPVDELASLHRDDGGEG